LSHVCRSGLDQNQKPVNEAGLRDGQLYELVGEATNVGTRQLLVVYRGVDGPDAGVLFAATLSAWHQRFEEVT